MGAGKAFVYNYVACLLGLLVEAYITGSRVGQNSF